MFLQYSYVVRSQAINDLVSSQSSSVGDVHPPKSATPTIDVSNVSGERRIDRVELLVSHPLDEGLMPRALRLGIRQLPEKISVGIAVDPVFGRSVRLPFVGVVESSQP